MFQGAVCRRTSCSPKRAAREAPLLPLDWTTALQACMGDISVVGCWFCRSPKRNPPQTNQVQSWVLALAAEGRNPDSFGPCEDPCEGPAFFAGDETHLRGKRWTRSDEKADVGVEKDADFQV